MTLKQLHASMDGNELLAWQMYYQLEPWGPERMDLHYARLMAQTYNIHRSSTAPSCTAEDFLLDFLTDPQDVSRTQNDAVAALQALTTQYGGTIFDDELPDEELEAYILQRNTAQFAEEQ